MKEMKYNEITGSVSKIFSELAKVNCDLWHEQEKVYEFEKVPFDEKDNVVKQACFTESSTNTMYRSD